jgi:UrcA family protein
MTTNSTNNSLRRLISIALALGAVAAPTVALADTEITIEADARAKSVNGSFTTYVGYGDLNLASADGSTMLKSRIKSAARDGCNDLYRAQPANQTLQVRSLCFERSVADAMPRAERLIQLAQAGNAAGEQIAILLKH